MSEMLDAMSHSNVWATHHVKGVTTGKNYRQPKKVVQMRMHDRSIFTLRLKVCACGNKTYQPDGVCVPCVLIKQVEEVMASRAYHKA